MTYEVRSYENAEIPPRWMSEGTFETAAEAIAKADSIIRRSLEGLYQANGRRGAEHLYDSFMIYGEVPSIFCDGEPPVAWRTYRRVYRMIEQITGERLKAQ